MGRGGERVGRVVSIDPSTRGFGFAAFEAADLIDWGLSVLRDRSARAFRQRVKKLFVRLEPTCVVLEDSAQTRRRARARRRMEMVAILARERGITVVLTTRSAVKEYFGGHGATKERITTQIVRRYPELARFKPPVRKPWMSEDERMNIFDAASFALASGSVPDRLSA